MSGTDAEVEGGAHGGGGRTDASEREIPVHATSDDGGSGGTAALRRSPAPGRKNKTENGQSKLPEFLA